MKIGVRFESLGMAYRPGFATAARLGVGGVQLDAVGDLAPDRLGATGRKELRHLLRSYGLELTALNCPLRHGLDQPLNLQQRIEHVMKVLSLSFELGAGRVIVEAGRIPTDESDPRAGTLRESLAALGAHGDRVGAVLALEAGMESGEMFGGYLAKFDTGGLGVNYDPANFVIHGFDPVANLTPLKNHIVHTRARDARTRASRGAAEVPLGHGDIEWLSYLGTLAAIEYSGWVVVATEEPDAAVVEQGVHFLRRLM